MRRMMMVMMVLVCAAAACGGAPSSTTSDTPPEVCHVVTLAVEDMYQRCELTCGDGAQAHTCGRLDAVELVRAGCSTCNAAVGYDDYALSCIYELASSCSAELAADCAAAVELGACE